MLTLYRFDIIKDSIISKDPIPTAKQLLSVLFCTRIFIIKRRKFLDTRYLYTLFITVFIFMENIDWPTGR